MAQSLRLRRSKNIEDTRLELADSNLLFIPSTSALSYARHYPSV